jgi:hypothetical protein
MHAINGGQGLANGAKNSLDDKEIGGIWFMPEQGCPNEIVV